MKSPLRFFALAALGLGALCNARAVDDNDAELTLPATPAPAAQIAPAEKSPILKELEQLVAGIGDKLKSAQGELTAAQLSDELAQFDAIVKKYPDAKPEERAGVLWAKTLLYLQVLEDYAQAAATVRRLKTEFPSTEFAAKNDEILAAIDHGLSNGLIESVNTKIRLITRVAFGFRSPDALIGLAMLNLGGHRPLLPGR